jgi:hypothetical protein
MRCESFVPLKTDGDKELAVTFYKKALEAIPKDSRADKVFLENLKKGALQKLSELEKKAESKNPDPTALPS